MSADDQASLIGEPTAAEEPAAAAASDNSDSNGEPTAAGSVASAGGQALGDAETHALAPVEGGASSSDKPSPGAAARVEQTGKSILTEIQELKEQQKRAREEKKKISKDLRNAEKRRQRLKKRAKQLSDQDLLAVMTLRSAEQALRLKDADLEEPGTGSRSEGTLTPSSTGHGREQSESPRLPKAKARVA